MIYKNLIKNKHSTLRDKIITSPKQDPMTRHKSNTKLDAANNNYTYIQIVQDKARKEN